MRNEKSLLTILAVGLKYRKLSFWKIKKFKSFVHGLCSYIQLLFCYLLSVKIVISTTNMANLWTNLSHLYAAIIGKVIFWGLFKLKCT